MRYLIPLFLISLLTISCNVLSNTDDSDLTKKLEIENTKITNLKDIGGTYTLVNNTDSSLVFSFNSSCQIAFKVIKEDVEIVDTKTNNTCFFALTSFVLDKEESKSFELQNISGFNFPFQEGSYTIKAYLIGYEKETKATAGFNISF